MANLFFNQESVIVEENGAMIDDYGVLFNRLDLPGAILLEQLGYFIYARDGAIDCAGTYFWTDDEREDLYFEQLLESLDIEFERNIESFKHSCDIRYEFIVKA